MKKKNRCKHFFQGLSDAHYGHPRNLIKKERGKDMGDGWETARRKDRPPVLKVSFLFVLT